MKKQSELFLDLLWRAERLSEDVREATNNYEAIYSLQLVRQHLQQRAKQAAIQETEERIAHVTVGPQQLALFAEGELDA